jgi:uncharacterized protein with HEPN domain
MKKYIEYLKHIHNEIIFIEKFTSQITTIENLKDNEVLKRALTRSIEIIGEVIKNIPNDIRERYPEVLWKEISGTRDKLIHGYFDVDYNIVYNIIKAEIPILKKQVEKIINDADNS